eukprot:GHVH01007345.1.p1 GENE.GHVH01007345.1~~GHVH01007345.1.p1  ORF type:complete len:390 (-),score=64.93 GHVH01007345.1:105-1274(-)
MQPNPAINLVFTNIFMLGCCVIFHLINKVFPLLPVAFGGSWSKPNWEAIKGLLIPTLCLNGSILLKQNIIKNSGPGYAEMIAGIAVPVSAVVQYFLNGTTIGKLGIASCVVAFGGYGLCLPVCGATELIGGFGAATLNVFRASLTKRSNKKVKLSPGLNLVYTCVIGLPFYAVMAICGEMFLYDYNPEYNWRLLFTKVGPFPFFNSTFATQMFLAFCSNIIVFVIYDLASPLTYVICAGLKGIVQTFFDIFYIDYYFICFVKTLFPKMSVDPMKFKNHKSMTKTAMAAFGCKLTYFILYVTEKIIGKKKKEREQAALAVESDNNEGVANAEVIVQEPDSLQMAGGNDGGVLTSAVSEGEAPMTLKKSMSMKKSTSALEVVDVSTSSSEE